MAESVQSTNYRVTTSIREAVAGVVGSGISYPLRYNLLDMPGSIELSTLGTRINESIHIILATRVGERMFNLEFGSRLPELLFEANDTILKQLLVIYTAEALKKWEKRIDIQSIQIVDDPANLPNSLGIEIFYVIRNSHIQGSYVFPFTKGGTPTERLSTGAESHRFFSDGEVLL